MCNSRDPRELKISITSFFEPFLLRQQGQASSHESNCSHDLIQACHGSREPIQECLLLFRFQNRKEGQLTCSLLGKLYFTYLIQPAFRRETPSNQSIVDEIFPSTNSFQFHSTINLDGIHLYRACLNHLCDTNKDTNLSLSSRRHYSIDNVRLGIIH